jgi:hypothetical protein
MPRSHKICKRCQELKPLSGYPTHTMTVLCIPCEKIQRKEWRDTHPDRKVKIYKPDVTIAEQCCIKCGITKPISMYRKCSANGKGYRYECKECEYIYDRVMCPICNSESMQRYSKSCKQCYIKSLPKEEIHNREKVRTRALEAVARAIASGRLVKPKVCSRCNKEPDRYIEAHHLSYERNRYLDVVWLCSPCHIEEHRRMRLLGTGPVYP